ncbi:MAG: acyltransferase family protein [Cellulomonas sp.]
MTVTTTPNDTARDARKRPARADIQALRAIAVVLVIGDHMLLLQRLPGSPTGGFVGVDLFFVISGFLITGLLIRETSRTGRVSYRRFYARRARRILPAAVLVIVTACLASFLIYWPTKAWQSLADGFWSLVFLANAHFAATGADYFQDGSQSIFKHYWSLSVEEQFYIVWPLLIAGAVLLARRRTRKPAEVILTIVLAAGAVSFAWALYYSGASPTAAYYSTPARAFEFALGGAIAVAAPRLARLPGVLRPALGVAGFALIAVSVFAVHSTSRFPGPWALLPAIGAAIVIAAGTGTPAGEREFPQALRPVSYVGDISYSLYLWHWPIIVLLGSLMAPTSMTFALVAGVSIAVLSVGSYHFVEKPVRASAWLEPRDPNRSRPRSQRARGALRAGAAIATSFVVVVAVTGMAITTGGRVAADAGVAGAASTTAATTAGVDAIQAQIRAAVDRNSWAGLTPAVDTITGEDTNALPADCWNTRSEVSHHCVLGATDAPHTVAILGDSLAKSWVPGISAALSARPDWNLSIYAKVGCSYPSVPQYDTDGSLYSGCADFLHRALGDIAAEKPDVLVLASALKGTLPGATGSKAIIEAWSVGVGRTLDAAKEVQHIVILAPPPEGVPLASCANRISTPSRCSTEVSDVWRSFSSHADKEAASHGAQFVDTSLWFCTPTGYCPPVVGTTPVRRDNVHMTTAYSESLAPLLAGVLFPG